MTLVTAREEGQSDISCCKREGQSDISCCKRRVTLVAAREERYNWLYIRV